MLIPETDRAQEIDTLKKQIKDLENENFELTAQLQIEREINRNQTYLTKRLENEKKIN